jgi:hypothetical protein
MTCQSSDDLRDSGRQAGGAVEVPARLQTFLPSESASVVYHEDIRPSLLFFGERRPLSLRVRPWLFIHDLPTAEHRNPFPADPVPPGVLRRSPASAPVQLRRGVFS